MEGKNIAKKEINLFKQGGQKNTSRNIYSFILILSIVLIGFINEVSADEININDFVNNNGIIITTTEYDNLINLGFTENEILNMKISEFNENKDLLGKVISMYYAKYATGSYNTAGSELLFLNNYDGKSAIWMPSGVNTLPAFFGDNPIPGECSGSRTNSVYCAISGYSYRLYHKNTSSSNTSVSGQFTLTEH